MGVIGGDCFKETTGSKLASSGVPRCQQLIDDVLNEGGGVIFIDEAYQLTSGNSPGVGAVLDFLLAEVENLASKICFVLAGYNWPMETFFAHNPGLPSRFPIEMKFADYSDDELLKIMEMKIHGRYEGRMQAEDGLDGLFCRIVTRRLGRSRGKEGFGNARAVENMLATIYRKQSGRLQLARRQKLKPDDLLLMKEDIIGPEPSSALLKSDAWKKLQSLIGLGSVKESVQALVDTLKSNYDRELAEQPIIEYSLNRCFLGNPGTGKTTVAKIYGQILVDIGLLSNGEVIVKNPADFVGSALGVSEKTTTGILNATIGKVLVIDEAYGLYSGGGTSGGGSIDPYKTAVVDTIVANAHSAPGDDRCVLLLGYKEQMEEMFQNVNPGFSRRFPISSAFDFIDFDKDDMKKILDLKLKHTGFIATQAAKAVALEILERARNRPNFGNAGEVDILLDTAKMRHQKRQKAGTARLASSFEPEDFDENYTRMENAETNVEKLFESTVSRQDVVARLKEYQKTVRTMKSLDMDPKEGVPFNFIFRGPPGTGKSTTARKMGQVFCDMGFLSKPEVIDCSASDLVGQFVGQTGLKVRQLLDRGLGRVVLIDEAYRLADGHFAKEALDEIVDAVTKPRYYKKLIVILAGYENDINRLLDVNPGLSSRFPEVLEFGSLDPESCTDLLVRGIGDQKRQIESNSKGSLDISCLQYSAEETLVGVKSIFDRLAKQPGWGNARDVQSLVAAIVKVAMNSSDPQTPHQMAITEGSIFTEMNKLLSEREKRATSQDSSLPNLIRELEKTSLDPPQATQDRQNTRPNIRTETTQIQESKPPSPPPEEAIEKAPSASASDDPQDRVRVARRDAGVSDEVWDQLQKKTLSSRSNARGTISRI